MIDYLKNNYQWIGAVVVPFLVALIGFIPILLKKSDRSQKVGDINGNGNTIINGDVKKQLTNKQKWRKRNSP